MQGLCLAACMHAYMVRVGRVGEFLRKKDTHAATGAAMLAASEAGLLDVK